MLKLFRHYVLHKAGPDIEKALDPVLVFMPNIFELVERRYLSILDVEVNQPDM